MKNFFHSSMLWIPRKNNLTAFSDIYKTDSNIIGPVFLFRKKHRQYHIVMIVSCVEYRRVLKTFYAQRYITTELFNPIIIQIACSPFDSDIKKDIPKSPGMSFLLIF